MLTQAELNLATQMGFLEVTTHNVGQAIEEARASRLGGGLLSTTTGPMKK